MTGKRLTPLLSEALPSLAAELADLLDKAEEQALARQIPALHVKSRCGCGDDFCATVYTGSGKPDHSVDLEPAEGMMIVDVDDQERILGIEILYRPEYKTAVDALFSHKLRPALPTPLPKGEA